MKRNVEEKLNAIKTSQALLLDAYLKLPENIRMLESDEWDFDHWTWWLQDQLTEGERHIYRAFQQTIKDQGWRTKFESDGESARMVLVPFIAKKDEVH